MIYFNRNKKNAPSAYYMGCVLAKVLSFRVRAWGVRGSGTWGICSSKILKALQRLFAGFW